MLLLQTQDVLRRFGSDVLFHNVNMQIKDHARVGLVGRNGAGKTTLLKMIAGITQPDEGTITHSQNLTIGYLAQDQGLDSENTIWAELDTIFAPLHDQEKAIHNLENQMANVDPNSDDYQQLLSQYDRLQNDYKKAGGFGYESQMRGVLKGFGFPEDRWQTPINSLSGGQKTKIALAKILLQQPGLLILDEPTNHLDMNVLAWLEDYLHGYDGALLIVTHDRYFLDKVVNEVYDLTNGTLVHYTGNYTAYAAEKAHRLQTEMKHYEQQQKKVAKLEDYVNRNIVRASTTKQAQARRKQLEKMELIDRPVNDDQSIHFSFHQDHSSGNEVLDVDRLKIGYQNHVLAGPLSFQIRKFQRAGIIGPNGIGKSTLLKTILKQLPPLSGTISLGANLQIGYYDQEQQQLHADKTVLDEVWDEHPDMNETAVRSLLGSLLFVGDDVYKTVAELSGGQKARLELTKLSLTPMNFLILDEPTNHLDIDSREVLETAIHEFPGTVLFISHDRYFLNSVATDILAMSATGIQRYEGNYDDYLKAVQSQAGQNSDSPNSSSAKAPASQGQQNYQASKQKQRDRRKLQRAVDKFEVEMDELQQKHDDLQAQMSQPEVATDIGKLTDLQKQVDQVQSQLDEAEENWTEAAEKLEEFDAED